MNHSTQRASTLAIVAALSVAALSGCSSSIAQADVTIASLISEAEAAGGADQIAMLEDEKLSTAELERSIDSMFECFSSAGIWYDYEGVNPVDGWTPLYGVNMDDPGAVEGCEQENFRYVSLGWELLNEDVMDPALMTLIQECLIARGDKVTGAEKNLKDLAPAGADDNARVSAIRTCATSDPERFPSLTFTYE